MTTTQALVSVAVALGTTAGGFLAWERITGRPTSRDAQVRPQARTAKAKRGGEPG